MEIRNWALTLVLIHTAYATMCSGGVDTSRSIGSRAFTYPAATGIFAMNLIVSADVSHFYLSATMRISSVQHSATLKISASRDVVWENVFEDRITPNSLILSQDESFLAEAFVSDTICPIAKIDAATGSVVISKHVVGATNCSSVAFNHNQTQIFVAGIKDSSSHVFVLNSTDFSIMSTFSMGTYIVNPVKPYLSNGSQMLLMYGFPFVVGTNYDVLNVNADTLSLNWSKEIDCVGDCTGFTQPAIEVLEDKEKAFYYLRDREPLFYVLNLTTGSLISDFYSPNFTAGAGYNPEMIYSANNDKIILLVLSTNGFHKVDYDYNSDTFSSFQSSAIEGDMIADFGSHTILAGTVVADGYNFFSILLGDGNNDASVTTPLTPSTNTFVQTLNYTIMDDLTMTVTSETNPTVSDLTLGTGNPGTYTENPAFEFDSDVIYDISYEEVFYVLELQNLSVSLSMPCSLSGATAITSTIEDHPVHGTAPSWVSIGADGQSLDLTSPSYATLNLYYLTVRSTVNGQNVDTLVTVEVYKCQDPNCGHCAFSTMNICDSCNSGFELIGQVCTNNTETQNETDELVIDNLEEVNIAIAGVAVITPTISVLLIQTSLQGIWSLVNQYQLYLMLPFMNCFLPTSFYTFVDSLEFNFVDFSFLDYLKIPILEDYIMNMDYKHPYEDFQRAGVESGSYFVSQFQLYKLLTALILFNTIIAVITFGLKNKSPCFEKIWKFVHNFFHFTVYIRIGLEAFLFSLLSSCVEISITQSYETHRVSYILAAGYTTLCMFSICFVVYYCLRYEAGDAQCFGELVKDVKEGKVQRLYHAYFLLRRSFIVISVICFRNFNAKHTMAAYTVFQIICLFAMSVIRPHKQPQDNILEVLNDCFYTLVCACVAGLQYDQLQSKFLRSSLVYMILANTILVAFIHLTAVTLHCIKKLKARKAKNNVIRVKPITPATTVSKSLPQRVKMAKPLKESQMTLPETSRNMLNQSKGNETSSKHADSSVHTNMSQYESSQSHLDNGVLPKPKPLKRQHFSDKFPGRGKSQFAKDMLKVSRVKSGLNPRLKPSSKNPFGQYD